MKFTDKLGNRRGEYTTPTIKSVQLETSVALRIVKQSQESANSGVCGPLFGTDVHGDVLKITHSYKYPSFQAGQPPLRIRYNQGFHDALVQNLKDAEVSVQNFGWFQTTEQGKFVSEYLLSALAQAQLKSSPNSVLIVHDPSKAAYGVLSLRAFRLTKDYLQAYIDNKFTPESLNSRNLSFNNVLEELPVSIHNNHLISLYLANSGADSFETCQSLESTESKNTSTLNNIQSLLESVDDLQNFFYQLGRKKQHQANQTSSSSTGIPSDANLFELLPLSQKVNFITQDIEQTVLSQFFVDSAIKP